MNHEAIRAFKDLQTTYQFQLRSKAHELSDMPQRNLIDSIGDHRSYSEFPVECLKRFKNSSGIMVASAA